MSVKIYTRKGDDGTTGLWYGGRVAKHHPRTEAYGTIDEACSQLGIARALASSDQQLAGSILDLQQALFVVGAQLATAAEATDRLQPGISMVTAEMTVELEHKIDFYMSQVELPPKFIIPGGTHLSAVLDVARTVLRRAERQVVSLTEQDDSVDPQVLNFLNRASDLLFAMARFCDCENPEVFVGRGAPDDK